ncbi:hypothetical protein EGW08_010643 [Elysia chlorotica]|uniref:PHD-type domain-containing protein n=1 Tax=Elysia chlorotica TaxID=188477 RepID=A0A433TJ89_ELYCH|nr:hypothetical protein EGW08_010643 [Elysia chlorotica]
MSKKVKEMIGGCCVCSDERGWSENPLVYCDGAGCNVAVHQACYGIVQVPTGPWFCRKCESQERVARVKCELCPQRAGALKRTDSGGWCHVVCALYIPEACFANVQTMEPIVLNAVPTERFNKICYICEEQKRDTKATAGACMQCNRTSCKQYFHVTCAQAQGLLCEVTGSYENVTYCGYCSHHYKKLKNHSNVKTIPAFRPIPNENGASDSSPEKTNPPKLEMGSKVTIKPTTPAGIKATEAEKSPQQVDQSVSSTSDSVPASGKATENVSRGNNAHTIKTEPQASQVSAQVSDVSSAVSPTGGCCTGEGDGGQKSSSESGGGSSDHSIQEPSSSVGVVGITSSSVPNRRSDKGAASSSTEQLLEVDVETESVEAGLSEKLLPVSNSMAKRQHSGSQDSPRKSISKKQKGDTLERKERLKKAIKKRQGVGGTDQASSSSQSSSKKQLKSPPAAASTLPGHHDYCGNTFGGSPYFQSLSTSGRVSMPSLTSNDHFTHFPYPSCMGFGFQDNRFVGEPNPSEMVDSNDLVQPPKYFPSTNMASSSRNHDRSQDMPLSMEQLLEQQWEQGAQFLMQQGDHFDISSLLNCLHKLKGENLSLEEQVKDLKSRRNHLMMVNARLALPFSLFENNSTSSGGPGGPSEEMTESATRLSETRSSVGSLEDISSPDDVQPPKVPPVHIPSHTNLVVEDIVSPVETPKAPLSLLPHLKPESEEAGAASDFPYTNQTCPPQPLMYSAVNPPPPSLSAISSLGSSKPVSSSALKPPSLTLSSSSSSFALPLSSSSTSLSSPLPPTLDASHHMPSLSSLSLTSQTD